METPIDTEVRAILEKRRGDWQAISDESKISHSWLSKFVNGHIPNPGLTTLRKVREAITRIDKKEKAGAA